MRAEPESWPDLQTWAVLADLAFLAHEGRFDELSRVANGFLDATSKVEPASAVAKNQRRYLAAVAPFLNKPAPAVRADHWVGHDGLGQEPLAALRGKVVLLDFWQPWCEPCRRAMPTLVALQRAHKDLQVLGLCHIEDYGYDVSEKKAVRPIAPADYPAHVADFRKDMAIEYPLVVADTKANYEAFRVSGIPTIVLIDREGIVRYMSCGAGEPGLLELAVAGVLGRR
jgi:thiol-disulfide isomerase/thioredoxin